MPLPHCYRVSFRGRQPRLRDTRCWLHSLTTGAAVAFAFAWVPLSFAQSGKNIGDLQFMGETASESSWMHWPTLAAISNSRRPSSNWWSISSSLAGGAFHISVSPVVTSGNGGVHHLFEISGGKAVLVDSRTKHVSLFFHRKTTASTAVDAAHARGLFGFIRKVRLSRRR